MTLYHSISLSTVMFILNAIIFIKLFDSCQYSSKSKSNETKPREIHHSCFSIIKYCNVTFRPRFEILKSLNFARRETC